MQSACAVLYCHLWPVWLYHTFAHCLINVTIFGGGGGGGGVILYEVCFDFLCNFCVKNFSF
jgi:hypothetical protein